MTNDRLDAPSRRLAFWVSKFIALYAVCDGVIVGIASVILKISIDKLWIPFLLFLVCGMVLAVMLYGTEKFGQNQNRRCLLFASSVSVYFLFFMGAVLVSGVLLGYLGEVDAKGWIPYIVIGVGIEFFILYSLMSKRTLRMSK